MELTLQEIVHIRNFWPAVVAFTSFFGAHGVYAIAVEYPSLIPVLTPVFYGMVYAVPAFVGVQFIVAAWVCLKWHREAKALDEAA
ncbi:hypothetical protein ABH15_07520 [Methanoculleus taiwanensis]|uniref:Uncharacterized protein n=1 Tax=Methanoculleus taiwanensis TaxID=1550565 RepID=A0A498H285_9EURY|nr:hypothetical protein [Methanoculleus taiwanensis]RXE56036.1 hypothetical protein ABH15_07520 [Methanoculleus taiwanensis]